MNSPDVFMAEYTELPLADVLSLQSVAVGKLQPQAHRVVRDEGRLGFVVYDNIPAIEDDIVDGKERLLGIQVGRRQENWGMRISFLEYAYGPGVVEPAVRETFMFGRYPTIGTLGRKVITVTHSPRHIVKPDLPPERAYVQIGDTKQKDFDVPLLVDELAILSERMYRIVANCRKKAA